MNAQPVTVTNLAGRAISGELIDFSEKNIQLQAASGAKMTLPLKIFPASEIAKLRKIAGIPEPPSPAAAKIQRDLANELARIDAREKAGTLSAEDAAKRRAEARAWADLSGRAGARPVQDEKLRPQPNSDGAGAEKAQSPQGALPGGAGAPPVQDES